MNATRGHDANGQKIVKRRKVALACEYCRNRKTRCDGRQPACSACESKGLGVNCRYQQSTLTTKRYVSDLEARVREYERRSQATVPVSSAISEPTMIPNLFPTEDGFVGLRKDKMHSQIQQQPDIVMTNDTSFISRPRHDSFQSDDRLLSPQRTDSISSDAMVVVPSAECNDGKNARQFSSISFIQSILRTVSRDHSLFKVSNSPTKNPYPFFRNLDEEALFLPPRKLADGFVQAYWKSLHPILPILHRSTFMGQYDMLWTVDNTGGSDQIYSVDDAVFFSTLNIVLAIGCQFSEQIEPARKSAMASRFYQRSKALLADELLDHPTLALVQLLLLTGVYLQSTEYANRCWNVIGSAIRLGQSIGLHLDRKRGSINQLEREIERRVWHTCVFLDRQLACTFGRPPMILDSSSVPKPAMIDDEYLSENSQGIQPRNVHPQMGCFVYSCNLFDILHQILVEFYVNKKANPHSQNTDPWLGEDMQIIMGYHRELNKFQETLPTFLAASDSYMDSSYTGESGLALGSRILHSRLLYIRTFLLRPVVLLLVQAYNETGARNMFNQVSLDQHLARKACTLCISTTQELVAHMDEHMGTSYWTSISHKIHYAFACVVVLAAARLCPILSQDIGSESIQTSWLQCMQVLDQYKLHFPAASHVSRILEVLESRLPAFGLGNNSRLLFQANTHTGELDASTEKGDTAVDNDKQILELGLLMDDLQELDFSWNMLF